MSYEDLRAFLDPDLYLPIGGKGYRVESPTAREGLRLRSLLLGEPLDNEQELAELQELMGGTLDEMRADGIKWPEIMHASRTALLHYGVSATIAEKHWLGGVVDDPGNPIPPEPATAPGVNPTSHSPAPTGPMIQAAASFCPPSA